ncbi:MAG: hypothetical protein RL757_236 [Bacteroidota bacterium]|jgi:lysozyme
MSCEADTERITDYPVQGIDISRYQEKINWDTVATQGINFAFVKATEGRQHVDNSFKTNWAEIRRVKIRRGAYHFFRPAIPPREQAENFMEWVELGYGDLPPVVDFEVTDELPRDLIIARLRELLRMLEIEYGTKPIIYTYYKFYNQYIAGEFDQHPIWIAKYGNTPPRLAANVVWQFWQYGNRGKLNGIKGYVDFNVFNGSARQLDSLCLSGASLSYLKK